MHLWWELSVQPSIYILKGSTPIASPSHYYIITMSPNIKCPLTSTCIQQLCSLDETQVTGPGPQSLGLPKAEPGVEVVCLQALLPINGVVATGIVWAVHPNLHKKKKKTFWITLAAKFWQEERNLTKNQHKRNLFTVALFYSVPVKSDGLWHMFAHSPHQDASPPVGLWSLGWLWWLSLLVGSSRRKWEENFTLRLL